MGIFRELASGFTLGLIPDDETVEEKKRLKCIFDFSKQLISEDEFQNLIISISKSIKRIDKVEFGNETVLFTVNTVSGLDNWTFVLDFNDYGSFSGRSWITACENESSKIPTHLQKLLYEAFDKLLSNKQHFSVCPNCNAQLHKQEGFEQSFSEWKCKCCGFVIKNENVQGGKKSEK